ncbi:MAG: deoxynucleoside kinase [Candidatus Woesearchaeota archaeon]|nr:deoxynucleoside kinase [Candidatus Woesearchaeota archaeon]
MAEKPFVAEFAGPPKSGKSTIIERIKYLIPLSISIIKEVSLDCPVEKKKTLKYMEWSANEIINRLMYSEEIIKRQIVLIDCGIVSQLALLEAFMISGRIRENEIQNYNFIREHLQMNLRRENILFYIKMNHDKELSRIRDYKIPSGAIINGDFLLKFNMAYEKIISELKSEKQIKIFEINGELEPEKNAEFAKDNLIREYRNFIKKR